MSRMLRFYLNIRDGDKLIEDLDGSSLPNLEAAQDEAFASARELLVELARTGKRLDGQRFEIMDEAGQLLDTIPFMAALKLD